MQPRAEDGQRPGEPARPQIAVLGASAGGVEALSNLVQSLPADTALSIAVVLHMPSGADSKLAQILSRAGPLPAVQATHAAPMAPGHIYVAPPDSHLVLAEDRMLLRDGPRENGFRPAIDPLFRSAARSFGPRSIGVILSGIMDDGAAGLAAIQSFGGTTIVQDPADAMAAGMPRAALDTIDPDFVIPATKIGALLGKLASGEVARPTATANAVSWIGRGDPTLVADPMELRTFGVDLACPECGGALQEIATGPMSRFRCRTGHVYSPMTLLESKGTGLEAALWAALRALEEEASMAGRLAERARESGSAAVSKRFDMRQGDAAQRADLVRQAIHDIGAAADRSSVETIATAPALAPGVVED